jgi:murein DD-endopeptidase MepM/ murein hydrolase activator NlpD
MPWRLLLLALVAGLAFWLGRQSLPEIRDRISPPSPHEVYGRRLDDAGLTDAALGRQWIGAARRSLATAPVVEAPFEEVGYLDPSRPEAVAYRFRARTGERLEIALSLDPPTNALVFLDLFRVAPDSGAAPVRVLSADIAGRSLVYEPGRDGEYLVRIQPELLRGGRYTLSVAVLPTMAFPVVGAGPADVHSVFGDPRDGGARSHHGIDIFADRRTPVVAAVAGRVSRVRTTRIGGRVVWLRDAGRSQSVYYAHLEEQLVAEGDRVAPGDTLGLVGNSGNARTTPPHLHFGIYRRGTGPVNPFPFVRPRPHHATDPALAGAVRTTRRVSADSALLRAGPDAGAEPVGRLDREAPVTVAAALGGWLRVVVGDGRRGYLEASATGHAAPLREAALDGPTPLVDRPGPEGVEVARLETGDRVEVLGRLGEHLYVRAGNREAWLAATSER